MEKSQTNKEEIVDEKPPILSSWKQIYSIVLINLIVLILLFYIFTKSFS
jgi:hypothetical protein